MSAPTYVPGSVPSGQSAPFVIESSTDNSGVIVIVAATGISLILVCLVIRVYIRFNFSGPWQMDDSMLALATAAALVQSSVVCVSVHRGWGRIIENIDPFDLLAAEKLVYAGDLLYVAALALSKHSLNLLFVRLSPYPNHVLVSKYLRYICLIWAFASLFAISLRCHLRSPWIDITADQCPSMLLRWQIVGAVNIFSEAILFAMSIYLVVGLHMSLAKKSVVIIAFGLRLPVIAFCILRIHFFFAAFYTADPTYDGVYFSAWTQTEITFSIMAATIPCLKPFVSTLSTNWGAEPKADYTNTESSPHGSFGLRDLFTKSEKTKSTVSQPAIRQSVAGPAELDSQDTVDPSQGPSQGHGHQHAMNRQMLRGDSVSHAAVITHGWTLGDDGGSRQSNESQQMIIRKEVMYSVEHDGRGPDERQQDSEVPSVADENVEVRHAL